MMKQLIIADDFTGAMDTGVQFAKKGIPALVRIMNRGDDLTDSFANVDCEILVLDIESRHVSPREAAQLIAEATRQALNCNIEYIYKKTDSTLRGNIGSELAALLDTMGMGELIFVPAYPQAGRTTIDGLHYVNGVPLAETEFAKDPFNPVYSSNICEIIREQVSTPIRTIDVDNYDLLAQKVEVDHIISIIDAASVEDLRRVGDVLSKSGKLKCLAGCAGFAEILPDLLGMKFNKQKSSPSSGKILLVSGSMNALAAAQIKYGEENCDYYTVFLPRIEEAANYDDAKIDAYVDGVCKSLQEVDKIALCVPVTNISFADRDDSDSTAVLDSAAFSDFIGKITARMLTQREVRILIVYGGDTLRSVMRAIRCDTLQPVDEIESGVVYARPYKRGYGFDIITKAGGLGKEDIAKKIDDFLW